VSIKVKRKRKEIVRNMVLVRGISESGMDDITASAQLLVFLIATMSQSTQQSKRAEKAIWDKEETFVLLDYFLDHKAEAGDGGNFKKATLTGALAVIAEYRTAGPVKTVDQIKSKWQSVSYTTCYMQKQILTYFCSLNRLIGPLSHTSIRHLDIIGIMREEQMYREIWLVLHGINIFMIQR
jgi:hypothetical protein